MNHTTESRVQPAWPLSAFEPDQGESPLPTTNHMMLPHLATRLYGTPLLIARPKLDVVLTVMGARIGLPDRELALAAAKPKPSATPDGPHGLAVIPIHGTLVHRTLGLEPASGFTSYTEITQQLAAALENPKVDGILLDVDSPGGESAGVFELAARIRAASSIKPVWAHANDSALSAAYALAAGASRLTVSRTAGVGSIGVIALHVDQSVRDAKDGLTYTAVYAGPRKNDLNPHAPLTPEATATLQREVDRLYSIFVQDVAALRSLPDENVRATEAGIYFGDDAVTAGLADAVTTFDRVLSDFAGMLSTRAKGIALASRKPRTPQGTTANFLPTLEIPMNDSNHDPHSDMTRHPAAEDALEGTPRADDPQDSGVDPEPEVPINEQPGVAMPLVPERAETVQRAPAQRAAAPQSDKEVVGVISDERLNAAIAKTRAEALAIAELCQLAGQPGRIVEFLAEGVSPAQVRRALLAQRADQAQIASRITPEAGTSIRPEQSPVVAAVKKLHAQE